MARAGKTTTDHEEIKRWAESHQGTPAAVKGTGSGDDPGMLRLDFPGYSGAGSLRAITWREFFKWFDANELALVYRPEDRFNKLISRATSTARTSGQRRSSGRSKTAGLSPQQRAAETRKRVAAHRARAKKAGPTGRSPARAKAQAASPRARKSRAGSRTAAR